MRRYLLFPAAVLALALPLAATAQAEQTKVTIGKAIGGDAPRLTMIAARQWPTDKPLPDTEQFLARDLLDPTINEMGYVPNKIEAPSKAN